MWFSLACTYDPALVQIGFNQSVNNKQGRIAYHTNCPPTIPVRMWIGFADVHGIIKSQFGQFKANAVLFEIARRFGRGSIPMTL
jgi:hypothetical protein